MLPAAGLVAVEDFLFFPNMRPKTDLRPDFFRSGAVPPLEAAIEFRIGFGIFWRPEFVDWFAENIGVSLDGLKPLVGSARGGPEARSSSVAVDVLNRISLSMASGPKGSAIPVPGVLIGNSSSSGNGMGCEMVLPLIDPPVLALDGFSDLHLAAGPLVFILMKATTQSADDLSSFDEELVRLGRS